MVSTTSARSDSTRPWFTIGLTRQPTSISPHCAYMQMHCVYVCMKIRTSLRELRRGDGISRWSPRLFPRVLPVWGSLLPILTHMGLGRRAHLGIRHMVNMVGFVIWLESHEENTQGLTWAKIRSALICHTGVRPYRWEGHLLGTFSIYHQFGQPSNIILLVLFSDWSFI